MTAVYFTICSSNYLGYALTCRDSLLAAQPDARFVIYLADTRPDGIADPVEIVCASDLDIDNFEALTFKFSILEFNTAIKPACFEHAFDRLGATTAVYLDPDIEVHAPLRVEALVSPDTASAMLTPHVFTSPPADGKTPTRDDLDLSGRFNLGFLALADQPASRAFLDWWRQQCETNGYNAPERGLFVDQKFVDRAPEFLADAIVQRNPGWNVAYWNLHEREITVTDGGYLVNGAPLVFFHFSGVVPAAPSILSKHQTRYTARAAGPGVERLVRDYLEKLTSHGQEAWSAIPYAYGKFSDGTMIPDAARRLIWRELECQPDGKPLFSPRHDLCNARHIETSDRLDAPVTALMQEIHAMRPDLQKAYELDTARGRRGFARWYLRNAPASLNIQDIFVAPLSRQLNAAVRWLSAFEAAAQRFKVLVRRSLS